MISQLRSKSLKIINKYYNYIIQFNIIIICITGNDNFNNFSYHKQFIVTVTFVQCTSVSLVITAVGEAHFQDLIADVVSSFSGNSRHFEHDAHWTQNGMMVSETYTLTLASL